MPGKILRRCSICGKFHAAYLVMDRELGKGYYCYTCFRAWQAAHPPQPESGNWACGDTPGGELREREPSEKAK